MSVQDEDFPKTLAEAVKWFSDEERTFDYMKSVRWPSGVITCPRCGSDKVSFISTRKLWTCKECKERKQFTIKVATIMEDSAVTYDKWLLAFWMVANCKNGVSSYEVHRSIGVTQKTAWFMLQRIRLALQTGSIVKLKGNVEVDETFIGGRARTMNAKQRKGRIKGTGPVNLSPVQGLLERSSRNSSSRVILKHVNSTRKRELQANVREYVVQGAIVHTDELKSYQGLDRDFNHNVINHAVSYVEGNVHTNGMENFWSLLKRTIKGTYVSVEPFHLFRYLDEQAFRFNERKDDDQGRFLKAMSGFNGKRLTWKKLVGLEDEGQCLPQA